MQILILAGSPRMGGNSDLLAGEFARAAQAKGHTVDIVRVAERRISGCVACERCFENGGAPCVQKDEMQELYPLLNLADMVVFAAPTYYGCFPSQLKAVIDRFYPFSKGDKAEAFAGKQSALILCGASEDEEDFDAAVSAYELLVDFLGWDDAGALVAVGVGERGAVSGTEWLQAARDLVLDL